MEKINIIINIITGILFALFIFISVIGATINNANIILVGFCIFLPISLLIPILYYGVILQIYNFIKNPKNTSKLWTKRIFQTIPFILFWTIPAFIGIFSSHIFNINDDLAGFIVFISFILWFFVFIIFNKFFIRYLSLFYQEKYEPYKKYIDENKTKIGLFVRPAINNFTVSIANKNVVIKFDLLLLDTNKWELKIIDKIKGEEKIIKSRMNLFQALKLKRKGNDVSQLFYRVVDMFNYNTVADDIIRELMQIIGRHFEIKVKKHKKITLDINQASEAEFTAIPGVTIAKAKHLAKVRKKQIKFLTMNQFYKAIELDEEFIEQIQTKGNKIILNKLPEYKKIEINKE